LLPLAAISLFSIADGLRDFFLHKEGIQEEISSKKDRYANLSLLIKSEIGCFDRQQGTLTSAASLLTHPKRELKSG
jgi:hypothetical protein